jgi:hypothetical protein
VKIGDRATRVFLAVAAIAVGFFDGTDVPESPTRTWVSRSVIFLLSVAGGALVSRPSGLWATRRLKRKGRAGGVRILPVVLVLLVPVLFAYSFAPGPYRDLLSGFLVGLLGLGALLWPAELLSGAEEPERTATGEWVRPAACAWRVQLNDVRKLTVALTAIVLVACGEASPVIGPWEDRAGHVLPDGTDRLNDFALVVHVFSGHEHCGWTSITFMHLAWPPGKRVTSFDHVRQFMRDPNGAYGGPGLSGSLDLRAELPADAQNTGFHQEGWTLWVDPEGDFVYLVSDNRVERWPRADPPVLCE